MPFHKTSAMAGGMTQRGFVLAKSEIAKFKNYKDKAPELAS